MPKFIIEHLEPRLWKWCLVEYRHISEIVGKRNLIFTNVKKLGEKLKDLGKVESKSVKEMNLKNACVQARFFFHFVYYIFGCLFCNQI